MRTTITLDDDISARLEQERRKRRTPFKQLINEVLRVGLDSLQTAPPRRKPFRTRGFDLGPSLVGSLDNIAEVLARGEGEEHR